MIKDLKQWGYKSKAQFLRDRNVPHSLFEDIFQCDNWIAQKSALEHKECPQSLRVTMINSNMNTRNWYKRLVAYFCKHASPDIWMMAKNDPDKRIRQIYKNEYENRIEAYVDYMAHKIIIEGE